MRLSELQTGQKAYIKKYMAVVHSGSESWRWDLCVGRSKSILNALLKTYKVRNNGYDVSL